MTTFLSVAGQRLVGNIDGFFRSNPGDGTLGLPDMSRVPYVYAPMLEPVGGGLTWVIDQFRGDGLGAFKGSPDGMGALRDVAAGGSNNAYAVEVIPQNTGARQTGATRTPDTVWGPQDFALAVRHPGTSTWDGSTRCYVAFDKTAKTIGIRMTTPSSAGPWDAEIADSAPIALPSAINLWDGNSHWISVGTIGQHVLVTIDNAWAVPFRGPRAYHRNADGSINTSIFSTFPLGGSYGGFDARGTQSWLYGWRALNVVSGDLFFYDYGPLVTQSPNATTFTPTNAISGEPYTITGTVTGSKDGVLLAASSSASFTVTQPYGVICTRWGTSVATGGGLVLRRQDASNYLLLTSTALVKVVAGVSTTITSLPLSINAGANVVVRNTPTYISVYVDGSRYGTVINTTQFAAAAGLGFISPAAGTSQFRYLLLQPLPNPATLPS